MIKERPPFNIGQLEGAVIKNRLPVSPGVRGASHSGQSLRRDRSTAIRAAPKCSGWSKSTFLTLMTALK